MILSVYNNLLIVNTTYEYYRKISDMPFIEYSYTNYAEFLPVIKNSPTAPQRCEIMPIALPNSTRLWRRMEIETFLSYFFMGNTIFTTAFSKDKQYLYITKPDIISMNQYKYPTMEEYFNKNNISGMLFMLPNHTF